MKYLWLCLTLLLTGCSNQADVKPNLNESVIKFVGEKAPVYDAGYVDLNGDGLKDALVFLKGMQWCGSGGCTLLVFENRGKHYQFISKSTVTGLPISTAKTESHGWKDLIVWSRGKGLVLMKFNGDRYPLNPSLQEPASKAQISTSQLVLK